MDSQVAERRSHNRFGSSSLWHLNAVLRPGRVVRLVNLSSGGALIEGRRPLRPGSRVYLQLSTDRRSAGRDAQILRCAVASLSGSDGVQYHGALKFDQEWDRLWEELTRCGYAMPGGDASAGDGCGQVIPTRGCGTFVVDEGGR
jgi:hypothetical protein